MSRPTRQTAGGRAYLDLQNRARREGCTTQELLILYVLERWLARLAASPSAGAFIPKGGMLLAALDARRPTADVDLLARHLANDERTVAMRVQEGDSQDRSQRGRRRGISVGDNQRADHQGRSVHGYRGAGL